MAERTVENTGRSPKITRFFQRLRGLRVAVLGVGVSNTGLVKLLAEQGAQVTACDRREPGELGGVERELSAYGCTLRLGEDYLAGLEADVVFRTPGMNFHLPELVQLRRRGVVVTSEMEVFFDLCPCTTIAVTGSDGKTTTTTLIAELLRAQAEQNPAGAVHLGGNIGRALLPDILSIGPDDVAVVELSSFQLISMRPSPDIAVITNVAPNHLDVHQNMEEYVAAKQNIYLHQGAFSRTVLNLDNQTTAAFAPGVRGRLGWFSLEQPVETGAFLDSGGFLCRSENGKALRILPAADIRLPGAHNIANYLAAMAATTGLAGPDAIARVARGFGGVEHRMEFIRERGGVKWYNDSIATSPSRAIAGLRAFDRKLIIIAGGYDKLIPFEPLAPHIVERVKLLILTGDTADKIEAAVTAHPGYRQGAPAILRAENLDRAVALAEEKAAAGDVVSLSPACASYDRYQNFEVRGRHFKQLVNGLPEH